MPLGAYTPILNDADPGIRKPYTCSRGMKELVTLSGNLVEEQFRYAPAAKVFSDLIKCYSPGG